MENLIKLPYYVLFLFLFILAQSLSMWGQFVTLPYKNLTMWEAYKMAIPFCLVRLVSNDIYCNGWT